MSYEYFEIQFGRDFGWGRRQKNEATTLPKGGERHNQEEKVQERKIFWSALFTRMILGMKPSVVSYLFRITANYPQEWTKDKAN